MTNEITYTFDRLTKTYSPDETCTCKMLWECSEPMKFKEISLTVYCIRTLNPNGHKISGFDSIIPHSQETVIWSYPVQINKIPLTIDSGFNFEFSFKIPQGNQLCESVRGKFISVDYVIEFVGKRSFLQSDYVSQKVFFVVYPPQTPIPQGQSIEKIMGRANCKPSLPPVNFQIRVNLRSDVASFKHPPAGELEILESSDFISQITISYMRTEIITIDRSNPIKNVSEVCRMQIAETDPPKNVTIPFGLEWVRVLIAPNLETSTFSLSISLKVRVLFEHGGYATLAIPLKLYRDLAY